MYSIIYLFVLNIHILRKIWIVKHELNKLICVYAAQTYYSCTHTQNWHVEMDKFCKIYFKLY